MDIFDYLVVWLDNIQKDIAQVSISEQPALFLVSTSTLLLFCMHVI